MSNSVKRSVVLLDGAGPLTGNWVRLDTKYPTDSNRAIQGTVAGGTLTLEGTTVENIGGPSFGQDLIGNGGFDSAGGWIFGPSWDLNLANSGVASCDGTQTTAAPLTQANSLIQEGYTYTLTFTISNFAAGTITPFVSGQIGTPRAANGTFTEVIVAGIQFPRLTLSADSAFIGDIDNISLTLEVPTADIGDLQQYNADFTDVLNSSWTYVRATLDAGTAKVQGMI